jgi:uncharacterized membrane protein
MGSSNKIISMNCMFDFFTYQCQRIHKIYLNLNIMHTQYIKIYLNLNIMPTQYIKYYNIHIVLKYSTNHY